VKSFIDTGQFLPVQAAAAAALGSYDDWVPGNVEAFRQRRDALVAALGDAGFSGPCPAATMYLWVPVPWRRLGGVCPAGIAGAGRRHHAGRGAGCAAGKASSGRR
jgi:alanine-synthesizing transaminase